MAVLTIFPAYLSHKRLKLSTGERPITRLKHEVIQQFEHMHEVK